MTVHHADDWLTIHVGDNRAVLATLPAESVNCVVTSPPYYGLRDYGTATWDGGDAECGHIARTGRGAQNLDALGARLGTGGGHKASSDGAGNSPYRDTCGRCGAIRQDAQLGLEPTPDAYIANLVAVFREVRRVLRKDGTVWLNLGDSYATSNPVGRRDADRPYGRDETQAGSFTLNVRKERGLKPKDRMMIPARAAIALQADGWWLRDEIVWAKPNPMPSSVTDRTTPAHEMVYLLTKSARYWYDADAVREPHADSTIIRPSRWLPGSGTSDDAGVDDSARTGSGIHSTIPNIAGRNKRSVWTVATQPYPEAHFATFPEALIEPMILAGCPERVCADCGAPWERVVDVDAPIRVSDRRASFVAEQGRSDGYTGAPPREQIARRTTTGWRPTCAHDAETRPGVVLDPFAGSGTVGLVAERLGRRSVLVDLSADYAAQMVVRVAEGRASGRGPAVDMPVPPAEDGLWAS